MGDETALVAELRQQVRIVLVCWEHKKIVDAILPAFPDGQALPGLPTRWKRDRFDVVLRFDRPEPEAPWSFRQLFPKLLSGDRDVLLHD